MDICHSPESGTPGAPLRPKSSTPRSGFVQPRRWRQLPHGTQGRMIEFLRRVPLITGKPLFAIVTEKLFSNALLVGLRLV